MSMKGSYDIMYNALILGYEPSPDKEINVAIKEEPYNEDLCELLSYLADRANFMQAEGKTIELISIRRD